MKIRRLVGQNSTGAAVSFSHESIREYLHCLVELEKAGRHRYREKLLRKINSLQKQSQKITNRVPKNRELTEEQKAIYYSSWIYTGVRNLTGIPSMSSSEAIAHELHLDPALIYRIIRFLTENGLCLEKDGKISYGPASIHIDKDSPHVNKHHQNWRFQAIQNMEKRRDEDLFFTSPMSLSKEAFEEIRTLLPTVIQNIMKISIPSNSERVACLNIDWFGY